MFSVQNRAYENVTEFFMRLRPKARQNVIPLSKHESKMLNIPRKRTLKRTREFYGKTYGRTIFYEHI